MEVKILGKGAFSRIPQASQKFHSREILSDTSGSI
jgi:hypothetical protein